MAGDQLFKAQSGAFVFIPHGTIHAFRVESETARILNFYGPAGFEQVTMELGSTLVDFDVLWSSGEGE